MKQILLISALMLTLLLAACGNDKHTSKTDSNTIIIASSRWDSDIASANVMKLLLEKAGYEAIIVQMNVAEMWAAVANGKADAMVSAWLPDVHREFYEKYKDQIDNLGPNLIGTRIGLAVPDYVNILTIDELNSYYRQFDGKVFGLVKKTVLAQKTEEAMALYKVDFEYVSSEKKELFNKLGDTIAANEWIVITAWSPHWMFGKWRLKYLDDPEGIYGKEGTINTIVRKDLNKDKPNVWRLFKNFYWDETAIQSLMVINHEHPESVRANTQKWMDEHPDIMQRWLKDIKQ